MRPNQKCELVNSLQPKQSEEECILVSANSTAPPPLLVEGFIPILVQGGVAVAVIFAMSYFCQILLKSITQLIRDQSQKNK
jgi:hypothetical protein